MKEDNDRFSGNELDDSIPDESEKTTDADIQQESGGPEARKASGKRRILLVVVAGLCAAIFVSYIGWNKHFSKRNDAPIVVSIIKEQDRPLEFNSFVIPSSGKDFNYISLSVSFLIAEQALKKEMNKNRDFIRGKIYDLLKTYISQQDRIPSPETIKDIIEAGINSILSDGKIDGLYITQFLVI